MHLMKLWACGAYNFTCASDSSDTELNVGGHVRPGTQSMPGTYKHTGLARVWIVALAQLLSAERISTVTSSACQSSNAFTLQVNDTTASSAVLSICGCCPVASFLCNVTIMSLH